ncbi:MAG: NAD(P)/FAD-dependent oxidoreductase [Bdellovibrionota bacterium]
MAATRAVKRRKNGHKKTSHDAIVIGTGMGGSACGAILASHGFRTLVLEKNPRVGGSCSYYEKEGFHVDMGTHMFIRGNKGPFGECTRRLGMGTPLRFRHAKKMVWMRGFNMDVESPSKSWEIPWVLLTAFYQSGLPLSSIPVMARMFYDILTMPPQEIEKWDHRTIDEFMDRYTKDTFVHGAVGFLLGLYFILPTWQASAGESIWNLQHFFRDNNLGYPQGGAVAIPKAFLKGAELHGARVLTRAPVEKILVEDGRARGVRLKDGTEFHAPTVVSTSSMKDTLFRMVGREHLTDAYAERVDSIKGSYIAVQAKIGLRKKVTDVGCVCGGYPLTIGRREINRTKLLETFQQMDSGVLPKFTPIYCPIPSNFDPELAPPDHQILTACAVAPTADVKLQDGEKAWLDSLRTALYEMIPGLKENILFEDTFSVRAIAGWIGKSSGAAVTTAQTPDQVGRQRPGHRTPVRGLYLAGDCAGGRGVGTELACQSGMDCADLIDRDRMRGFV